MLIYVPGLAVVVKQCRGKNPSLSTDVQAAIKEAGSSRLGEHTHEDQGHECRAGVDLRIIESVGRTVAEYANCSNYHEKQTVPVPRPWSVWSRPA